MQAFFAALHRACFGVERQPRVSIDVGGEQVLELSREESRYLAMVNTAEERLAASGEGKAAEGVAGRLPSSGEGAVPPVPGEVDSVRIDRWLYHCRFFKTRGLAWKAVSAGHVRLNGERPAPGRRVKAGDRIDLVRDRLPYALEVLAVPARRGPAAEARRCYREDEEVVRQREAQTAALRRDRLAMPRTDGRPDKRTRRLLRNRKAR